MKSEFVHIRPYLKCTIQTDFALSSGFITERDEIRVLELFIRWSKRIDTTFQKTAQCRGSSGPMVLRISNKQGGLSCNYALRLTNEFVTTQILNSAPYLHFCKCDVNALEVTLNKVYKRALDLPISTSNQRLVDFGMTNTFEELREAPLNNKYHRLSKMTEGRRLLARLHISYVAQAEDRPGIPEDWRPSFKMHSLPNNMDEDNHEGRRDAPAKAVESQYGSRPGMFSSTNTNRYRDITFRAPAIAPAEEVAAADPRSRVVITDSQGACQNLKKDRIAFRAARILKKDYRD
ncbi:hypothetical protein HPB48_006735 [Haemaphysalis longicornis]|uniref:Uncharacterized protein n=1 Tax=Haemaphysalis longicornis TaxID=44386 RepID=A0A9J6G5I7_HAELO|nr:hypothetical protein HPB48_006735 [Haemaphysalis longicornis]